MAAVLAKGTCTLENAAREPEIVDLCKLLIAMGADIEGVGSDKLVIHGRDRLHGATYSVMPDRIEAGRYASAAPINGGLSYAHRVGTGCFHTCRPRLSTYAYTHK